MIILSLMISSLAHATNKLLLKIKGALLIKRDMPKLEFSLTPLILFIRCDWLVSLSLKSKTS